MVEESPSKYKHIEKREGNRQRHSSDYKKKKKNNIFTDDHMYNGHQQYGSFYENNIIPTKSHA